MKRDFKFKFKPGDMFHACVFHVHGKLWATENRTNSSKLPTIITVFYVQQSSLFAHKLMTSIGWLVVNNFDDIERVVVK